jgi:hypothetical protein
MSRRIPKLCLAPLFAILLTASASAQELQSLDSAKLAGRSAAEQAPVGNYSKFAFLGGIAFGFFGLSLFTSDFESWKAASGIGIVGVAAAATRASADSRAVPDSITLRLALRDSAYVAAFTRSYDRTLKQRRQTSVGTGASLGTLTGLLVLVLLARGVTT